MIEIESIRFQYPSGDFHLGIADFRVAMDLPPEIDDELLDFR